MKRVLLTIFLLTPGQHGLLFDVLHNVLIPMWNNEILGRVLKWVKVEHYNQKVTVSGPTGMSVKSRDLTSFRGSG